MEENVYESGGSGRRGEGGGGLGGIREGGSSAVFSTVSTGVNELPLPEKAGHSSGTRTLSSFHI